jgi:hypothetical protein
VAIVARLTLVVGVAAFAGVASAQMNAAFVSQSVPTSMTGGQRYPVSITMRNTGSTTWTNTTGPGTPNAYSLGSQNPQDNVIWGLTRFPNRAPVVGSVAPGATTTFNFDVVAPATPGVYNFQWQMVDDFVAWFGALTPNVRVTVSAAIGFFPNAQFVSQSVPASMTAGQSYPVSVTMRNTGNSTWTNTTGPGTPNAYSLGSQNPQDNVNWGLAGYSNRVAVAGSVVQGATTTFAFNVVAPTTPGTYNFQWQMVDDYVAWFGAKTPNVQVSVSAPAASFRDAQFVSQSIPSAMMAGQRYPVTIKLRNTGNTTWTNATGVGTPNSYSLGAQNPQDNVRWGLGDHPNRTPVTGSVAPGATATFVFDVIAPTIPGTYNFQRQMVQDFVAWFGATTPNVAVTVEGHFDFEPGPIDVGAGSPMFAPAVIGDVNGDGWLEPVGMLNAGNGQLTIVTPQSMGIEDLFSSTRPQDLRLADLNGDGCEDLVAQGYSAHSETVNVESRALLYFNDGKGSFLSDPSFADLNMNGRGEGLIVADFNNDGASDLYLPYYTFGRFSGPPYQSCIPDDQCPNASQSYLLLNDGRGHFTNGDVPGTVDLSPAPGGQPEGVQAADVNDDGRVDLYVSGYLFLNRGLDAGGRVIFEDCKCGIPATISGLELEEGAKFLDWNNDGKLDIILHHPDLGPQLYENVGTATAPRFELKEARTDGLGRMFGTRATITDTYEPLSYCASYGLNVYDLDNNGLEDVVVAGSPLPWLPECDHPNVVFRNSGEGFESVEAGGISGWGGGGVLAFADFSRIGQADVVYVGPYPYYFVNATDITNGSFTVEVLGANGEHNQHGRVMRVSLPKPGCTSPTQPGCTLTRIVDGGSGLHSQNQYPLLIGTPYARSHRVEVLFPDPAHPGATVVVGATVNPGKYLQVFAPSGPYPNGRTAVHDHPPTATTCIAD